MYSIYSLLYSVQHFVVFSKTLYWVLLLECITLYTRAAFSCIQCWLACIAKSVLITIQCTVHRVSVQCTIHHWLNWILSTHHWTQSTECRGWTLSTDCSGFRVHISLFRVLCRMFKFQFSVFSVLCFIFSVPCSDYSFQCSVFWGNGNNILFHLVFINRFILFFYSSITKIRNIKFKNIIYFLTSILNTIFKIPFNHE